MKTRLFQHKPRSTLIVVMLVIVLALALSQGAAASTGCQPAVTVTSNGDSGPGTLRQAIVDVCEGGVIDFDLPLPNTINLNGAELLVDKAMSIDGPGADQLAISTSIGSGRILQNQADGLHLSSLTIRDGLLGFGGSGGGILNLGVMTINNCIIRDNEVNTFLGGTALGGGVANYGTMLINNSTITQNRVVSGDWVGGGGISNTYGTVIINNSTISNNDTGDGAGGGIFNFLLGTVVVNYSTIVNNDAHYSGDGIGAERASPIILRSSIIANNGAINCSDWYPELFVSLGHNLSNTDDCNLNGPGDLPNTDPLLGPLQNNGGTTPTHALLPGSPAIDAAALACPAADQRGVTRPQGPRCDIGAFEAVYDGAGAPILDE